jgi:hypothetical protein
LQISIHLGLIYFFLMNTRREACAIPETWNGRGRKTRAEHRDWPHAEIKSEKGNAALAFWPGRQSLCQFGRTWGILLRPGLGLEGGHGGVSAVGV